MSRIPVPIEADDDIVEINIVSTFSDESTKTRSLQSHPCSPEITMIPDDFETMLCRLMEDEKRFVLGWEYSLRLESRPVEASARDLSIAWIRKVSAFYGFQPLTTYLSINYLDRFLAARQFPNTSMWPYQLLSVACLSIAAKMEELLVPSLIDLQMEGVVAKHVFEPKTVQRMELLVLSALEWRMRFITPFSFLAYFACKLDPTGRYCRFLVLQASDIVLASISDATVFQYRPTCIAAAALLCVARNIQALSQVKSDIAESWSDGLSRVKITSCCNILHRNVVNTWPVQVGILQELHSSSPSSELSCSSSSPPKRRKLCDQIWTCK